MNSIFTSFITRKKELEKLKQQLEKQLSKSPEGFLRISNSRNHPQYYLRTDPKDKNGIYIPQANTKLICGLAQKGYNKKVLQSIEQELNAINKYITSFPHTTAEEVYETITPERRLLISPILETNEQYAQKWSNTPFETKGIGESTPPLLTEKGEPVRSKSEVIIADILHREGIPYRYECPLLLKGGKIIHPDFTTLNIQSRKILYWEHLGKMDDPIYAQNAIDRLNDYEENGISLGESLIVTWETKNTPLNPNIIRKKIRNFLK